MYYWIRLLCCHVLHNTIQCAADSLPTDVEAISQTFRLFSYIYCSRGKIKKICKLADVQYQDILAHTKTR